jgi:hypothetical protein
LGTIAVQGHTLGSMDPALIEFEELLEIHSGLQRMKNA